MFQSNIAEHTRRDDFPAPNQTVILASYLKGVESIFEKWANDIERKNPPVAENG